MKIVIVGTGYVGLVSGACFAEMGVDVTCVDIDNDKIDKLQRGIIPIYEPGLEDMVKRNVASSRLHFSTSFEEALPDAEIVFAAVGTPPGEDGSADLKYVIQVARQFGSLITDYKIFVTKSTVPVGTSDKVRKVITEELEKRGVDVPFDVASNPEFLKEGAAIKDFMTPDRVVVGTDNENARRLMARLYKPFMLSGERMIFTDIRSSEMIKYAANSMLATRISFMNDIANLCELVGADVNMVRKGIAADMRIGNKFLYPGIGYGGSCFPKDVKALIHTAREHGYDMKVLRAVEEVNNLQKKILFNKLDDYFSHSLKGKTIAVWGLSFKPETDDMREAPSIVIISALLEAGATVRVFDPIAVDEARRMFGDRLYYAEDMYDAALDADALMLLTEWNQFRLPALPILKKVMRNHAVFDGRNIYDRSEFEDAGFDYFKIG